MADTNIILPDASGIKHHSLYALIVDDYLRMNGEAYDNTGRFIDGGDSGLNMEGLFTYTRETAEGFLSRKKMCYNPGFATMLADTMINYPFKYQIERSTDDQDTKDFMLKTDVKGEITMQELMLKAHRYSYVYGWSYVVVDKPEGIFTSKFDEVKNGRPYAYVLRPQDVINWQYDAWGRLIWVWILEPTTTNANDPFESHEDELQYRIWTRDAWYLVDKNKKILKQGAHTLGEVPIRTVRYKNSLVYPDIGMTEFTSISRMQLRLFNLVSELDQLLRGGTFSILALPDLRDLQKEAATNDTSTNATNPTLSHKTIIQIDPESRHMPAFISPDSTCTDAYFKAIDMIIAMMRETAKQKYNGGVRTSGVEAAFDHEETNTAIVSRALRLADDEKHIIKLANRWLGKDVPDDLMIKYPDDYNVRDLEKEIDRIFNTLQLKISDTFNKELKKSAARKIMPELTPKIIKSIEAEIDAAKNVMDIESFMQDNSGAE